LIFGVLVIELLTLKLRLKSANLFFRRTYLRLCLFQTIKGKQKTFTNYLRYWNILQCVPRDFEHSHKGRHIILKIHLLHDFKGMAFCDRCQTRTQTKRLWSKSKKLPNQIQLKGLIFWNRQNCGANYAKPKSVSAKPLGQ